MCFLVTVRPTQPYGTKFDRRQPFVEQTGLVYVRGCEIQGMLDDKGRVIEEGMLLLESVFEMQTCFLPPVAVASGYLSDVPHAAHMFRTAKYKNP